MAVARQAARLAAVQPAVAEPVAVCKAAAQLVVPEQMPVACRAAAVRLAAPEQTAAACKVAAARRAVDLPAALRVAVECKAAVLLAAEAPQVALAPWVAALRVAAAVIRRPGAEPLAVAAPKVKAAVLKVHRAAAEMAVAAAVR